MPPFRRLNPSKLAGKVWFGLLVCCHSGSVCRRVLLLCVTHVTVALTHVCKLAFETHFSQETKLSDLGKARARQLWLLSESHLRLTCIYMVSNCVTVQWSFQHMSRYSLHQTTAYLVIQIGGIYCISVMCFTMCFNTFSAMDMSMCPKFFLQGPAYKCLASCNRKQQ